MPKDQSTPMDAIIARLKSGHGLALLVFLPGLIAFALSQGPLSWDGSYYVFRIVHEGAPPVFHDRWPAALLSVPAWLVHESGGSLSAIRLVFSITYASVPVVVMALALWLNRSESNRLTIFSTLGIAVVTMPLQFFAVSEALVATQLAWVLLIVLRGPDNGRRKAIGALLAVVITLLHPVTAVFLATFLAISLLDWKLTTRARPFWSVLFGVCLAFSFFAPRSGYEDSMTASERIGGALGTTWASPPFIGLLILIGAIAYYSSRPGNRHSNRVLLAGLVAFGLAMIIWSSLAVSWTELLDYRFLIPLMTCPLLALAAFDAWKGRRATTQMTRSVILISGIAFSAVLTVQSFAWSGALSDFQTAVDNQDGRCIQSGDVVGEDGPIYRFWTLGPLSVVMRERNVDAVVISIEDCDLWQSTGQLRLTPEPEPVGPGWFRY